MGFNGKHLSLEDRKIIEENINKGLRKFETAKELNKSQSTIGKEIKTTENIDIHKQMMLHGNVNIIKTVKFVLEGVLILKKFHALEEIDLLVHVMVALK